jgi:hypothetical protein
VSAETRFGSAYTAIRMLADAALLAHGYRTLSSRPGHHRTAIESLAATLGVDRTLIHRLDALRKQRNLAEYSGETIPESAAVECLESAEALHATASAWLRANRRDLLPPGT